MTMVDYQKYLERGDLRSTSLARYPTGRLRTQETGENIDWKILYDEYLSH